MVAIDLNQLKIEVSLFVCFFFVLLFHRYGFTRNTQVTLHLSVLFIISSRGTSIYPFGHKHTHIWL